MRLEKLIMKNPISDFFTETFDLLSAGQFENLVFRPQSRHGSSAERIYRICLNILVWFRISAQAVFSSCLEHLYILFLISNFLAAADGAKDKKSKSNLFSLRLLLEKVCMGL